MTTAKVYEAITAVTQALSKDGIGKNRKNTQQNYNFRGIDDVYNELSPILSANKLCILPRIVSRSVVERQSVKGGALFYVTVEAEFDLISAEDGSIHVIRTFGEAMDSGDKATNKAMSAAYKYACMQAFCIPTEGDNDADATTHEVSPQNGKGRAPSSLVTKEQVDEMQTAIVQAGRDLTKFLKAYGIKSLGEIRAAEFDDAMAAITAGKVKTRAAA